MSTPRLTFLYPHLFKSRSLRDQTTTCQSLHGLKPRRRTAGISSTARRKEEPYAQRYGPAAEPQLPPPSQPPVPSDLGRDKSLAGAIEKEVKAPVSKQDDKKTQQPPPKETIKLEEDPERLTTSSSTTKPPIGDKAQNLGASESHSKENFSNSLQEPSSKPLATVLNREEPKQSTPEEQKPPHLQAPRYVHHFDTFTLVRDLQKGGFTQDQSVTLMKAVRMLLAQNLDVAHEGLVSKSDVENVSSSLLFFFPSPCPSLPLSHPSNILSHLMRYLCRQETYLFRAACSELRTEIANTRRASHRKTTTQLSHLTHEADILSQRLTQESTALKEDLRGMLNDRKMAVRMEQQAMDQAIQELNYKITVALMSGSKSEVEGLRWVLTRRAAMAIASMALLILGSLRYTTYKLHLRDQEQKLAAEKAKAAAPPSSNGGGGGGGSFTVSSREMSTQTGTDTEAMLANVSKDGSPAYVSLG
ncbi:MAG: hypothetical protein Q9225_006382 [Loekoesia sp. 1 TL-2023]